MKISPFAPEQLAVLPEVDGVRLATCEAGIKYAGRKDLLVMLFEPGTTVAGVFTKSKTASAPVDWCRESLVDAGARALVVNAGNANAFTGMRGRDAVEVTASRMAELADCKPQDVFIASTGVIGEPLDPAVFVGHLEELASSAAVDGWEDAARAIMTTDTYPKLASVKTEINGEEVTINGIAKGSGMIAPDMATMLAFFFTDAAIAPSILQKTLNDGLELSFNAITVDSDTSTSDTVLAFATGKRGAPEIADEDDPNLAVFTLALHVLMQDLAHQIVKDGEGASKFVTVGVHGAESEEAAKTIALAIANSPLVKTSWAGEDANWGRIVMAVGKAGEAADRDKLAIWFGDTRVAVDGERDPDYDEAVVGEYMKKSDLTIRVDVGVGEGKSRIWTCDFGHEYISINADYRS